MREAIKRIILRMFPEIAGGYHLDRYAKILKIADPPTTGVKCDRFRPYWAADIEIVTPEGEKAEGYPIYESVPLPVPAAGHDQGFYLWPRPGTIVTIRWIEGRPDHPVIQNIYPMGLSMPQVPDNMGRWQQRPGVFQLIDPQGNWQRKTDKDIEDAATSIKEIASELKSINTKTLKENISENKTETIGGSSKETITGPKNISTPSFTVSSPTISMAAPDGGPSLLPSISSALGSIKQALETLATHSHPNVGACSQSGEVSAKAADVGSAKSSIDSLQG